MNKKIHKKRENFTFIYIYIYTINEDFKHKCTILNINIRTSVYYYSFTWLVLLMVYRQQRAKWMFFRFMKPSECNVRLRGTKWNSTKKVIRFKLFYGFAPKTGRLRKMWESYVRPTVVFFFFSFFFGEKSSVVWDLRCVQATLTPALAQEALDLTLV